MSASAESGTADLELHGAKTGNCLRAAIGLSEAGLQYEIRHVDLGRGEQRDEPHPALNPAGKVPVLVARGSVNAQAFVLTQSSAILFYADAEAPGRILPPHGDRARMRALERFFYFTSDVIALNGAAFSLRGPEFSGAAATLTERYLSAIAASERFLIDNEFVGGASFSNRRHRCVHNHQCRQPTPPMGSASAPGRLARSDRPSARCPNWDDGL